MRIVIVVLFLMVKSFLAVSQCILRMEYITDSERAAEDFSVVDPVEESIPSNLQSKLTGLNNFFSVRAEGKVYDGPSRGSSKILCSCQRAGCGGILYLGKKLIQDYSNNWTKTGDGLLGIMAHEIAHLYQCNKGTSLKGVQKELQADFLAGYFLTKRTAFTQVNFNEFAVELFSRGDFNFNNKNHHGTPAQRVEALQKGFYVNLLTLDDAFNISEKWLMGRLGDFNLTGFWNSTSGLNIQIFENGGNFFYRTFFNGIQQVQYTAYKNGPNTYNVPIYNGYVLVENLQVFVVDNRKAVVTQINGISNIWTR